jgi:hypothetical protein
LKKRTSSAEDPGCLSQIPDPNFSRSRTEKIPDPQQKNVRVFNPGSRIFSIPDLDPGVKKLKDPDPQHYQITAGSKYVY